MSRIITRKLRPVGDLKDLNRLLADYRSLDYERGTLEVHHVRGMHELTLRVTPPALAVEALPGTRKTYDVDAWPDYVRLVANHTIPSQPISDAGFQLDGTGVYSGDVTQDSDNVIIVGLTGVPVSTGSHFLTVQSGFYAQNGEKFLGTVWEGIATDDVFARDGEDAFYADRGGRVRLARMPLPRHDSVDKVLGEFVRVRNDLVNILDYVFLEADSAKTVSGWVYLLYEDSSALGIDYVDPARDAVVGAVGDPIVRIKFSKPLSDSITGDFQDRVHVTTHTGIPYETGTSATFHGQNDVVSVELPTVVSGDGVHFVRIDTQNLHADDGDRFLGDRYVYSAYYARPPVLVKNLTDLGDVDVTGNVTGGHVLTFNAGEWTPAEAAGGTTITGLNDVADVDITSPSDGESLTYEAASFTWKNTTVGGVGAPVDATYVTLSTNGTLTDERVLATGDYITITDLGAGLDVNVDVNTGLLVAADIWPTNTTFNTHVTTFDGHTGDLANPHITSLDNLDDTTLTTPTATQFLMYNGSAWIDSGAVTGDITDFGSYADSTTVVALDTVVVNHTGDLANPHVTSLSNLDDTTLTSPTATQVLVYNGSAWIDSGLVTGDITDFGSYPTWTEHNAHATDTDNPHTTTLSTLGDTTITSPTATQVLVYNGSAWIDSGLVTGDITDFGSYAEATHTHVLDDITDVTITTPTATQFLMYNGSVWIDSGAVTGDITDFGSYASSVEFEALSGEHLTHVGVFNTHSGAVNPHGMGIENLDDVSFDSASAGEFLAYDGASWVDSGIATGDIVNFGSYPTWTQFDFHRTQTNNPHDTTLEDLTDTTLTSPVATQFLMYNGSRWIDSGAVTGDITDFGEYASSLEFEALSGEYLAHTHAIGDLSDVTETSPATTAFLMYNGSAWIDSGAVTGDITDFGSYASSVEFEALSGEFATHEAAANPHSTDLSDLGDTTITSPTATQVLVYNGSAWIDSGLVTGDVTDFGSYASSVEFEALSGEFSTHTHAIGDLSDVTETSPATTAFLMYNGAAWIDSGAVTGDITDFGAYASSVEFEALSGEFATHEAAANPHATDLSDLGDTTITSPTATQVLVYNGSAWIDSGLVTGDVTDFGAVASSDEFEALSGEFSTHTHAIGDLSDVTETSPATTAFLMYNGSAWIDSGAVTGDITDFGSYSTWTEHNAHATDTANPHSTSLANLVGTTLATELATQALMYNGSVWINSGMVTGDIADFGSYADSADLVAASTGQALFGTDGVPADWPNGLESNDSATIQFNADASTFNYSYIGEISDNSNVTTATPLVHEALVWDVDHADFRNTGVAILGPAATDSPVIIHGNSHLATDRQIPFAVKPWTGTLVSTGFSIINQLDTNAITMTNAGAIGCGQVNATAIDCNASCGFTTVGTMYLYGLSASLKNAQFISYATAGETFSVFGGAGTEGTHMLTRGYDNLLAHLGADSGESAYKWQLDCRSGKAHFRPVASQMAIEITQASSPTNDVINVGLDGGDTWRVTQTGGMEVPGAIDMGGSNVIEGLQDGYEGDHAVNLSQISGEFRELILAEHIQNMYSGGVSSWVHNPPEIYNGGLANSITYHNMNQNELIGVPITIPVDGRWDTGRDIDATLYVCNLGLTGDGIDTMYFEANLKGLDNTNGVGSGTDQENRWTITVPDDNATGNVWVIPLTGFITASIMSHDIIKGAFTRQPGDANDTWNADAGFMALALSGHYLAY